MICPSQKILTVNLVDGKRKGKKKKRKKKAEAFKPDGTLGSLRVTKGQCQTPQYGVALWVCAGACGDGAMGGLEGGAMATLLLFPFYQSEVGSEGLGRMHCPLVPSCLYLTCLNSQAGCQCVITPFILFSPLLPLQPSILIALPSTDDNVSGSRRVTLIPIPSHLFKIIYIFVLFKKLNRTEWEGMGQYLNLLKKKIKLIY